MKKLTTKAMIAVVWVVCACSHAPAQEVKPDTVLLNGKIFTGVASRPYVEAVAIRAERIVATGETKTIQAMAGPKTNAIDLHGGTAIPGINDAHHHFRLGPPEVDVDLHAMDPTWAQVKDGIVAAIAKNPPNSLIVATIGFHVFADPSIDRDARMRLHRTIRWRCRHSRALERLSPIARDSCRIGSHTSTATQVSQRHIRSTLQLRS